MPKLEPKQIQKELESGQLWPVYWLYGQERMKSRELLKRIRKAVLGEGSDQDGSAASFAASFNQESLDGQDVGPAEVVDAAQSLSLGGGLRLIVIREAHLIKESEKLAPLLGGKSGRESLNSVCVFLSKDLDGRKKFSKLLLEKAAVVPCEEVGEEERESWIGYLAKRRGLDLATETVVQLRSIDPWTLDIVEQELEKYALAGDVAHGGSPEAAREVLLGSIGSGLGSEVFFDAFFTRKLDRALEISQEFADHPDESLPLLGLLSWNARYLTLILADRRQGTRTTQLSPFLAERFSRWVTHWDLEEALALQSALAELDYGIKQTPRLPLGLWTSLVTEFCPN